MDADRIDAIKWVSLFAHEIVFTHFRRKGGRLPFIPATVPIQTAARDVNNLGWLDGWLTPSSSWWYGWNMLGRGKGCFQRGIKNNSERHLRSAAAWTGRKSEGNNFRVSRHFPGRVIIKELGRIVRGFQAANGGMGELTKSRSDPFPTGWSNLLRNWRRQGRK
jgi:hypothetical protein